MNFDQLKQRVERSEMLVDGRVSQTQVAYSTLRQTWREAWTPGRIVVAGLLSGFIAGRAQPARALRRLGAIGGPQWIRMVSALSGLFASLQAATAAAAAKGADAAAETADDAAEGAETTVRAQPAPEIGAIDDSTTPSLPTPSDRRRRADPAWDAPPRPAEAATDVSER